MALVSVIIPAYNCEKTISKTISSVFAQDLSLIKEVLIYEDFSSDNTLSILKDLAIKFPKISIVESKKNSGAGVARNKLLSIASGKYIAFIDSDDFWYPDKINKQIEYMNNFDFDIVACGYDIYDLYGTKLKTRMPKIKISRTSMHLTNWLPMSMTILRSNLLGSKNMPLIRSRQDYAYWLNLFKQNKNLKCGILQESLGGYTKQTNSISSNKFKNISSNYLMFRNHMKYGIIFSSLLVIVNILVRLFR